MYSVALQGCGLRISLRIDRRLLLLAINFPREILLADEIIVDDLKSSLESPIAKDLSSRLPSKRVNCHVATRVHLDRGIANVSLEHPIASVQAKQRLPRRAIITTNSQKLHDDNEQLVRPQGRVA